jgi:glycosyltransferase involved in cell wall biosynthesis
MQNARGEYIVFVNDDDDVPDDWLERLTLYMDARPGVDVYSIQAECLAKDQNTKKWFRCWYMSTSLEYGGVHTTVTYPDPDGTIFLKDGRRGMAILCHPPWMWCVWRTEVARKGRFSSRTYGEDTEWANAMVEVAQSECIVPEVLYRYFADDDTSEAGPWKDDMTPCNKYREDKVLQADPGVINAGRMVNVLETARI